MLSSALATLILSAFSCYGTCHHFCFQHFKNKRQNFGLNKGERSGLKSSPAFFHFNTNGIRQRRQPGRVPRISTKIEYASPGMSDNNELRKPNAKLSQSKSYVSAIRSCNLAGVIGTKGEHSNQIEFKFNAGSQNGTQLVAVTGETGSGKSLLVARVCQLVTGGKIASSLLQLNNKNGDEEENFASEKGQTAMVEIELQLFEPHLSATFKMLQKIGFDATSILGCQNPEDIDGPVELTLKRILPVLSYTSSERTNKEVAVKSTCTINGHQVPLKVLRTVGSPLLAIVDAPAASASLKRPQSRLQMIDTAVPPVVLLWVRQLQNKFNECRAYRESLEEELENRVLPPSFSSSSDSGDGNDMNLDLLCHWVDELDGFERRVSSFCDGLAQDTDENSASSIAECLSALSSTSWEENDNDREKGTDSASFSSALYKRLLDLSDALKAMDEQIASADGAYESLASLSSPESAKTALERTRNLLMEAIALETGSSESGSKSRVVLAAEQAHNLLNDVEDSLLACARFLDDDEKGLLATLRMERAKCLVDVDAIAELITEWNTLARKHGISPYVLPSCHSSLRQEYTGNVEARDLLPKAVEAERRALEELEQACQALSRGRLDICRRLSKSITARLPLLGMEGCTFEARLDSDSREPTDIGRAWLGVDSVDFMLFHTKEDSHRGSNNFQEEASRGGKLDSVGSSGEKARLLLGIECDLPGSVSALCGTTSSNNQEYRGSRPNVDLGSLVPPIAVVYDEIDAHVGGRAAVSVGQMLSQQSRSCQVVSITHSPSVAAIADLHFVVQKQSPEGMEELAADEETQSQRLRVITSTDAVEGPERRRELARMASGDMAPEEAEAFAEALIRHGAAKKVRQ